MNQLINDVKLVHVLILDISGVYSSIYDEFWCNLDKVNETINGYSNQGYKVVII